MNINELFFKSRVYYYLTANITIYCLCIVQLACIMMLCTALHLYVYVYILHSVEFAHINKLLSKVDAVAVTVGPGLEICLR